MPDSLGHPVRPLDLDVVKSRYDFELECRDHQTSSLGLPVGVLDGLGSVIALMARSFTWSDVALKLSTPASGSLYQEYRMSLPCSAVMM